MEKVPTRPLKTAELELFFGRPSQTLQSLLRRANIPISQSMPLQLIRKMYKKGHTSGFESPRGLLWRAIRPRMEEFVDGLVEQGTITIKYGEKLKKGLVPEDPEETVLPPKKKKPTSVPKTEELPPELKEVKGEGIEAAIVRLRGAEKFLHEKWKTEMEGESYRPAIADKLFNQWQKAIEHLRKGEESLLVLQSKAGTLIEADVARRLYAARILPIKKKLERMPSQLCTVLENDTAEAIKEELEKTIRGVLGGFSGELEDASKG